MIPLHLRCGWRVISRSHHGRIDVMLRPVMTTEAHLAFACARTRSKNTAEMTAMVEALSFLGPRDAVARDAKSCIYYDPRQAAGVCLGTIQARTHVHKVRFTMRHVYGHTGNLGNECADHAAALGTLGLVPNRNIAPRWVRHNFDSSACSGPCNNIGEVLEKLRNIRTETTPSPQDGS